MTRRWVRRLVGSAIGVVVLGLPAYWWLIVESGTPSGEFSLGIEELRHAADAFPGERANAVRAEAVAEFRFPATAAFAGDGWAETSMPVFAYELQFGDHTALIDSAVDEKTAGVKGGLAKYDAAAYARVQAALERAAFAVVTHEHYDHLGGVAAHPKVEQLMAKVKLTPEQLSSASARAPLEFSAASLAALKPLAFEKTVAVAPGVVLVHTPGHTPGSQLVYVRMANDEEFLFLGDVAWHRENWEQVHERARLVTLMIGEDRDAVLRQLAAVKALQRAAPKLHVVPGHDGRVIDELVASGAMTRGM